MALLHLGLSSQKLLPIPLGHPFLLAAARLAQLVLQYLLLNLLDVPVGRLYLADGPQQVLRLLLRRQLFLPLVLQVLDACREVFVRLPFRFYWQPIFAILNKKIYPHTGGSMY